MECSVEMMLPTSCLFILSNYLERVPIGRKITPFQRYLSISLHYQSARTFCADTVQLFTCSHQQTHTHTNADVPKHTSVPKLDTQCHTGTYTFPFFVIHNHWHCSSPQGADFPNSRGNLPWPLVGHRLNTNYKLL